MKYPQEEKTTRQKSEIHSCTWFCYDMPFHQSNGPFKGAIVTRKCSYQPGSFAALQWRAASLIHLCEKPEGSALVKAPAACSADEQCKPGLVLPKMLINWGLSGSTPPSDGRSILSVWEILIPASYRDFPGGAIGFCTFHVFA